MDERKTFLEECRKGAVQAVVFYVVLFILFAGMSFIWKAFQ